MQFNLKAIRYPIFNPDLLEKYLFIHNLDGSLICAGGWSYFENYDKVGPFFGQQSKLSPSYCYCNKIFRVYGIWLP